MERQASLWLEIANDLSSHILGEQSMKAIKSSYDHLEGHLKPPLLYMAYYFPEDDNIPVSKLLEWWMAEEIVHNLQEEAANVCLNELVSRSLVMVSKRSNQNGNIKYCMLHDVVREFCLKKLSDENFRQYILPYDPSRHKDYLNEPVRSIWFINEDLFRKQNDWLDVLIKEKETHDQRFDQPLEFVLPPNCWHPPCIVELGLNRVLRLGMVETLSISLVEALKLTNHLRHLQIDIEGYFDFEWVSHLCHLQVLSVSSMIHIRSRVAHFWKLTKLSHVYLKRFSFIWEEKDIDNFNNSSGALVLLENLKIFSGYYITNLDMKLQFWNRFPNLEKFNFNIDEDAFAESVYWFPNLKDNVHLQSLKLVSLQYKPSWAQRREDLLCFFPFSLKYVQLERIFLSESMLSLISILPNLENLKLKRLDWHQRSLDMGDNKFTALKSLEIGDSWFKEWHFLEENFPELERLVLKYCFKLEEIPDTFADIPTLKLIELDGCKRSLAESALKIKKQVEDNTGCDSLHVLVVFPLGERR